MIDMHVHTTASDGVHSPADVVRMAKAAGLSGIAITDHDTIAGVREAVVEGAAIGIQVVPGIEVSTDGGERDVHIPIVHRRSKEGSRGSEPDDD